MPSAVTRFVLIFAVVWIALLGYVSAGDARAQDPFAQADYFVEPPPVTSRIAPSLERAERLPPPTLPESVVFPPPLPESVVFPPPPQQQQPYYFATERIAAGPLLQEPVVELDIQPPPDRKPGVFQKVDFSNTWIDRGKTDDLGINRVSLFGVFAFPAPRPDAPLIVTPGFAVRYLDGPIAPDLPSRVYDAYLEMRHLRKISERLGIDVGITPGIYSDFERYDDAAIRISGRAIGSYQWHDDLKLILGIVYLDRDDVSMLPVTGLIWTPNDDWRMDLVFPQPRIARRIRIDGWSEDWFYLAAEFGGGSWLIERVDGTADQITLRDYRLLFGLERKSPLGRGRRIEIGYVFGRTVEYADGTPDINPNSTAILRAGITY